MGKVLFSPLGLSNGSLFTAIVLTRPDYVVVITSGEAARNLDSVLTAARRHHPNFQVEHHVLEEPFADFVAARRLARELAQAWAERKGWQFIVNLSGGTTVMQDCVTYLAHLLGARLVAVVDRRPSEEQLRDPLALGELVEVPPFEGMAAEVGALKEQEGMGLGAHSREMGIVTPVVQSRTPDLVRGDVALFMDWENIKLSVVDALGRVPDIQAIKKAARSYGRLALAKAYANWADPRHRGDAEALYNQGIEPVFVPTYVDVRTSEVRKNSVDVRMAIDCIETALTSQHLTTLVLVAGDKDYLHVVNTVRALGKRAVVIAASGSVAYPLTYVPDDFRLYEELVSGFVGAQKEERAQQVREALNILASCVRELAESGADNTLANAKTLMRRRVPDFQEERLGFPGFAYFAFTAEREGLVRIDATVQPPRIYPAEAVNNRDGQPLPGATEWTALIQWMKEQPTPQYPQQVEKAIKDREMLRSLPQLKPEQFVSIAVSNGVLIRFKEMRYHRTEQKMVPHLFLRLNEFDPRVQVYLGLATPEAAVPGMSSAPHSTLEGG
jgi:uncharacterized protein (TIGR00288 family)